MSKTEKIIALLVGLAVLAFIIFERRPLASLVAEPEPTDDWNKDAIGVSNMLGGSARGNAFLTYNLPWRFAPPVQMLPTVTKSGNTDPAVAACGC